MGTYISSITPHNSFIRNSCSLDCPFIRNNDWGVCVGWSSDWDVLWLTWLAPAATGPLRLSWCPSRSRMSISLFRKYVLSWLARLLAKSTAEIIAESVATGTPGFVKSDFSLSVAGVVNSLIDDDTLRTTTSMSCSAGIVAWILFGPRLTTEGG